MMWENHMDCKSAHPGSIPGVASNVETDASLDLRSGGVVRRRDGPGRLARIAILLSAMPPHRKLAPPATHDGNVDREHEQAEGDHPESQDRKEAQEAARHEQNAEADADRLRLRQVEIAVGEANLGGHDRSFGGSSPHRHGLDAPQSAL